MKLRKIVFWMHLLAGVVAGLVILIMSATGVALAFEKDLIAWAERDVRRVSSPLPAPAVLPLEDLVAAVREIHPQAHPSGVTLHADPRLAVQISLGRTNAIYANPYTGELQPQGALAMRRFMRLMIEWHRYLGARDEHRAMGKAITGACNAAFLLLAVSGLYLWLPQRWSRSALRPIVLFNPSLRGKARDWNWHNVLGFWSAPVIIILTLTAMPISYRWAGDLIYKLAGAPAPAPGSSPRDPSATIFVPPPPANAAVLDYQQLFAAAKREAPEWHQISMRLNDPGSERAQPRRDGRSNPSTRAERGQPRERDSGAEDPTLPDSRPHVAAVTMTIKELDTWPRTASTTLTLDPFTGAILRRDGFSDLNRGRQARVWTRFLHTGEALGWGGQFIAGLASLGGVLLVWTGLALAYRRFFKRGAVTSPASGSRVEGRVQKPGCV